MMCYLEQLESATTQTFSKKEALAVLQKYRGNLNVQEYRTIFRSLSSLAMEGIYLNEKDILLSIAQLRNEITLPEIIALTKSA